ncbi:MAG: hypothetical protein DBX46_04140 [Clostridiales bacterium]|nr:MAG: hypothetical protein DBX46_04140 [Clostridiales bacterium]
MNTLAILGAGQFGRACLTLLNQNNYRVTAFGDNNVQLAGASVFNIPVVSVEQALASRPDMAIVSVKGSSRTQQLRAQAQKAGYSGKLLDFDEICSLFSIRGASLVRLAERFKETDVKGAIAELGVYRGETAAELNALFPNRDLHLFDTFEGFDARDITTENEHHCSSASAGDFSDTSVQKVLASLPCPEQAIVHKGYFPQTTDGLATETYALVSLDADLYAPTFAGLEYFHPRLCHGGAIVLHDYNSARFSGVKKAVKDYEAKHGRLLLMPLPDTHGTAIILNP